MSGEFETYLNPNELNPPAVRYGGNNGLVE